MNNKIYLICLIASSFMLCGQDLSCQEYKRYEEIKWNTLLGNTYSVDSMNITINNERVTLDNIESVLSFYKKKELSPFINDRIVSLRNNKRNFSKAYQIRSNGGISFPGFRFWSLPDTMFWNEDPFKHRSWQWSYHSLTLIDYLISGYLRTDSVFYIIKAKEIFYSWNMHNLIKDYATKMSWNDHVTPLRLYSIITLYGVLQQNNLLDKRFIENFIPFLWIHNSILSKSDFYAKHHNHGFTQSYILFLSSHLFSEFNNSKYWKEISTKRVIDETINTFSINGIHLENSPGYHVGQWSRLYSANKYFNYFKGKNITENFYHMINQAMVFIAYIMKPNSYFPIFGDTQNSEIIIPNFFKQYDYCYGYQFMQYASSKGELGIRPPDKNIVFTNEGYAIFRDDWHKNLDYENAIQLVFKSSYLQRGHSHNDDLSFVLFGYNEDWITEGGRYTYRNDSIRQYVISNKSHNVVLVNDLDYIKKIGGSKIVNYSMTNDTSTVTGEHNFYKDYIVRRNITQIKKNSFSIYDSVSSMKIDTNENNFKIIFHIPKDKTVVKKKDRIIVKSKKADIILNIIPTTKFDKFYITYGKNDNRFPSYSAYSGRNIEDTYCLIFEHNSKELSSKIDLTFEKK